MAQNARATAFTVSELLRKNQHEGGGGEDKIPPTPTNQIRFKFSREIKVTQNKVLGHNAKLKSSEKKPLKAHL